MGLFRLTISWYSIFYLIVSECVRDKPKKSGNGYGGGNGTGNDNSNSDIIITMGTTDRSSNGPYFSNGNNFKINDNNNIFGDDDGIEETGQHKGPRFISRGSILQNRNRGLGVCKVVDFEPFGRNPWEKDEAYWYHGGIIGTTLVQGCMFLSFLFFFCLFSFLFFVCGLFSFLFLFSFIFLWFVVLGWDVYIFLRAFCNFL